MQILGRLNIFILGAVSACLVFSFFPLVIHEDHTRAFVYIKQVPTPDFSLDCTKNEVSMRPQHIELRDGNYKAVAELAIASNTMRISQIRITDEAPLIDKITRALPLIGLGILIGLVL